MGHCLVLAGVVLGATAATAVAEEPSFTPLPPPSLNFYGVPGLLDMPSGEMLPDGQYTTGVSYFGGQARMTLTFQATPWMSASFRYNGITPRSGLMFGFPTYYDRGFDVRFRLLQESRYRPAVTLGLQDFVGTGIYASEYIVATKNIQTPAWGSAHPGELKLTAGMGWGRLGSHGSLGSTGNRPPYDPSGTGGQVAYNQWFRGPFAPFAGVEWQPNDRWGFKAEYSSDAYVTETQTVDVFDRKSSFNFGVEYQAAPRTRLGAYYLYGSEFGVTAQFQLNPYHPVTPMAVPAPQPLRHRPARAAATAAVWSAGWAASTETRRDTALQMRARLEPLLQQDGLVLEALDITASSVELRYRNLRYRSQAAAVGRAARALAQVMPASVETFRLVPVSGGLGLSATVVRRSDLEALEFGPQAAEALLAVTGFENAGPLATTAVFGTDLYPEFSWSVSSYFDPAYFDPDKPLRLDLGVEAIASYQPAPGWVISGALRQRIVGNVAGGRPSNSQLPHVRTDQALYAQHDTTLNTLYVARQWRAGRDLYARATAGYLETMYGGLSGEVLWKPVNSPLALGVEANYVRKRDFDQQLGFQDYSVLTGHASAYMDLNNGFHAQIDAGRYLAGDYGATFSLDRVFDNGWSVGGFFTMTNVSAEEFGEGSFDKGIRFTMPLGWFLGKPSRKAVGTTIRPIQRDGGQRVHVPGRLYGQVRDSHQKALEAQWSRVWE
jgi:hypothetical protein